MKQVIYLTALLPLLAMIAPSAYAHQSNQDHFTAGWNDGYNDAMNHQSPADKCIGHTHSYCDGYNQGYIKGNGSPYFYNVDTTNQGQSSNINIKGNDNTVNVNQGQASDSGNGGSGSGSDSGNNPQCKILCFGANVN